MTDVGAGVGRADGRAVARDRTLWLDVGRPLGIGSAADVDDAPGLVEGLAWGLGDGPGLGWPVPASVGWPPPRWNCSISTANAPTIKTSATPAMVSADIDDLIESREALLSMASALLRAPEAVDDGARWAILGRRHERSSPLFSP
jgi:hypothetical protein